MHCPRCPHDVPTDAAFCPACGASLSLACSQCGTANAPGDRFCKKCGRPLELTVDAGPDAAKFASPHAYTPQHLAEKILTSRSALEGERKLVTVLFVDVEGFTGISEKLDPEDVHQLMDRAFEMMLAEIHRYEGTVNQFLGDGLMALFGAPIAHEDHTIRAVHAALGIQRAFAQYRGQLADERRIDVRVRMGMNTGSVVVGKIGDNLRMDYTAVGDTTNVAARLLALAEAGQILASEEIFKAAAPFFVLQPLGEVQVKGKALPVRVYRVEGARAVRSRIEAASDVGLTPLCGRGRELALLQDRLVETCEGRGQAVFVFGEAGVGKSRLVAEFRRTVEAASGARWLIGRSVSYGQKVSYLPVIDVIRDLFHIEETDDAQTTLTKVSHGIRQLGDDLEWTEPFIRGLLSLDPGDEQFRSMIPAQRQGRSAEAVRALVARLSEQVPVIVLVEDLHWMDRRSEDVVRMLVEAIAALPVLILLTYRPGHTPPFGDQTYYTRITLHGLTESLTGVMIERVLGSSQVPPEVRELILRKAEGNPLFVEELSKALVEDGTLRRENGGYRLARPIGDVAIPDTIQGVIMARIDRLPEASKSALQIASVIGREFTARLVERVSAIGREAPKALGELRAVELIYEKTIYPELAYMFKHALAHDVAYESLLKQRRRALHRRVGEVIEELYPDRLPEFHETLAWHFTQGEVWTKATDYLLKAADKARAMYAYRDASRYAGEAVEILDKHRGSASEKFRALETLADLESFRGKLEAANQAYDRAVEVATDATARPRIANKRHREGVAVRNGARIAYYEHGTKGPVLFLMHPAFYGIGVFQPLVDLLSGEFRMVTVDPLGTGQSDPLPVGYRLRDYAADAHAVIEAIGVPAVVLIGISRGGSLALNFTATWPQMVEKLVLIGTNPTWHGAPDCEGLVDCEFWMGLDAMVRADDYVGALAKWLARGFSEDGLGKLFEAQLRQYRQLPREVIRNFLVSEDPDRELRPLLPRISVPTLVLHGEDDRMVPLAAGRYLAAHIPHALCYVFKGRGHVPQTTAPVEFAQLLRSFIFTGRIPGG